MSYYIDRGYKRVYIPEHLKAQKGYVFNYILVAEKALGHYLPDKAVVHHFDENRGNDANNNLVICENESYHHLLHVRQRVLKYGGDPNTDKVCSKCKTAKNKSKFRSKQDMYCRVCKAKVRRERYLRIGL